MQGRVFLPREQHTAVGPGQHIQQACGGLGSVGDPPGSHRQQGPDAGLVPDAELGGTARLWEWTGDGAATFSF